MSMVPMLKVKQNCAGFLFRAVGQVVGFLAEHTRLLILAAVAFLFEQYFKNQC